MKTLYAGPYIGEFGWELCWFNPQIRHLARQYEKTTVAAPTGSEYLYEFADVFIPLEGTCGWDGPIGTYQGPLPSVGATKHIDPLNTRHQVLSRTHPNLKWRALGVGPTAPWADIMCAFRPPKVHPATQQVSPGKEYPKLLCTRLVGELREIGFTVACYGGSDNYYVEGCLDLRGAPLEEQCEALGAARCAVGPSSGTMHLASLCRCPHVTWYSPHTHPELVHRYERHWNPFKTPMEFLEGCPEPETIVNAVGNLVPHHPLPQ